VEWLLAGDKSLVGVSESESLPDRVPVGPGDSDPMVSEDGDGPVAVVLENNKSAPEIEALVLRVGPVIDNQGVSASLPVSDEGEHKLGTHVDNHVISDTPEKQRVASVGESQFD